MEKEIEIDKFIDKIELFYCIKKRWKLIIYIIIILMIGIFGVNKFASKDLLYQSKTTIFIGKEESGDKNIVYQNADVMLYQSLVKSYEYIYRTTDLISSALKNDMDISVRTDTIKKNLKVIPMENTQILQVTYNDKDPNYAQRILELINSEFIRKINELVPNSNVNIIEMPQKSSVAINSKNRIPYIVGILVAIPIAFGSALVVERWNDYITTEEELEALVGKPILAVAPKIDMEKVE